MWANASQHSANVYVQYVCAPSKCVFSKCTIISSVCQFSMVTKGGYSSYSPNGRERCPKASEHHANTLTHYYIHTHTQSADSTRRRLHRYGLPDKSSIVCKFFFFFFCTLWRASVKEKEKPIVHNQIIGAYKCRQY